MSLPILTLKPRRARPFFGRHPWVFANAIANTPNDLQPGDEVALHTSDGLFIARGLFNPHSQIRVRLYCWDQQQNLDAEFWTRRIDHAVDLRETLFGRERDSTAARLVFSEGDGLSGLIVDQYSDWLLVQFTSHALHRHSESIIDALQKRVGPQGIWLRTEKGILESEGLEVSDGLLRGEMPPRPLIIEQHGVRYGVDVVEGQKTGFFIDQRDNRAAVARYTSGHRVLDAFCYTGGFGITAAKQGGAKTVRGLDTSPTAVKTAQANAELNEVSTVCQFEQADAKTALTQIMEQGERFDTVIIDPPRLARKRVGIGKAVRTYQRLNESAVRLLNAGGILVACSCSGLVSRDDFEQMLSAVAQQTKRRLQILEALSQPPDHPVSASCPESRYLKCYICRVE